MLKIAEECWKQIHGKIGEVVKVSVLPLFVDIHMNYFLSGTYK